MYFRVTLDRIAVATEQPPRTLHVLYSGIDTSPCFMHVYTVLSLI